MLQLMMLGIVAVGIYFAFSRMKGMSQGTQANLGATANRLLNEAKAGQKPNESEPIFVLAWIRNKLSASRGYFIGLSDQRLFLHDAFATTPTQVFERAQVTLTVAQKSWTDGGNAAVTMSQGWELTLQLPSGETISNLRLYSTDSYFSDQARNAPLFLKAAAPRG